MISLIICSIDDAKFNRAVECYHRVMGEPFEVIRIKGAAGMAEGYNQGVARSRGEVLIFSHDDVHLLTPNLAAVLHGHLQSADVLGIAGARKLQSGQWVFSGPPYVYGQVATPNRADATFEVAIWSAPAPHVGGMKALDGVFLCTRRHVVEQVPFDAQTFRGFHLYDIDFTFRAYQAGFRLAVCCDVHLVHDSSGEFLDDRFQEQYQLFMRKHHASLDPGVERQFRNTLYKALSLDEVKQIMTPPHWADPSPPSGNPPASP
jgi:GT2 family glycosyltransferase